MPHVEDPADKQTGFNAPGDPAPGSGNLSNWLKGAYSCGIVGWTILVSITWVVLVYIYTPPEDSGMVRLIPSVVLFGFLTLFSVILASGRLFDAVTDPLIARFTDTSRHRLGRRIPFMRWAIIPTIICAFLMFNPVTRHESVWNAVWLGFMQFGFFLFMTMYNVPYNAMLPELARRPDEKVVLATWQAGGLLLGMVLASQVLNVAAWFEANFDFRNRIRAFQYAILAYALLAGFFMSIPAWGINEKKHCISKPANISLTKALRQTLTNPHFRFFLVADFSYWTAMTIIYASLLFYVTVLLHQKESFGSAIMGLMIVLSVLVFPFMKRITQRFNKKRPIIFSFLVLGILMMSVYFLGIPDGVAIPPGGIRLFDPFFRAQGFALAMGAAIPLAFMSILPTALIAEISDLDGKQTGQQKEGLYFAVRNLLQKFGQTLGMMVVAVVEIYGMNIGDDLGIRLTGVIGLLLCLAASAIFFFFNESRLDADVKAWSGEHSEQQEAHHA